MAERKSLKINSDVYDRLAKQKGSKDTWDEFFSRLVNSVSQDQVHLDRATLKDFGGSEEAKVGFKASSDGTLELRFTDESGTSLGGVTLDSLEPSQEVDVSVVVGEQTEN
ncbi:hypothetical protein [Haloferax larsenii]|uniref:Uncharacterized protein n=1 Tax=Haloferax larsenii TaxID=302484 RepID=A0A1H7TV60_HALLR|nr:hypothetical protein [Haloferax larsenii]SEL88398.1 hypothetical protein SAMN04488691_11062 [Haloferax larsenii]